MVRRIDGCPEWVEITQPGPRDRKDRPSGKAFGDEKRTLIHLMPEPPDENFIGRNPFVQGSERVETEREERRASFRKGRTFFSPGIQEE